MDFTRALSFSHCVVSAKAFSFKSQWNYTYPGEPNAAAGVRLVVSAGAFTLLGFGGNVHYFSAADALGVRYGRFGDAFR